MADVLGRRTFVGRGPELTRLRAALAATVLERAGRSVVMGGEAGIGKSRLVHRFVEEVASSATVLEGACLEVTEEALPYAPFVEILRSVVRDTPTERLPALLGPGRAELTRLLPELAARAADLAPPAMVDGASQARLFELVLGVLERIAAAKPLILVIEDVHWADRSTRDLLGFLARALRDDPVLLLLTTRTDTGDRAGGLGFLAELEREDHVERIDVVPFDRDEVAEQTAGLLDEPPPAGVVDRLLARSDGNPFYVEELVLAGATVEDLLPSVLRDVLVARIGGLSPGARDVLRVAAAAGRQVDDELLGAALDLSPRELAPALREAIDSGILVRISGPEGDALAFRHALLHEVAGAELMPAERTTLHAAFATALEARVASGDRRVAAVEIARHWDAARSPARALPHTIRAAAAAEGVYAFAEAMRLWQRAGAMFEALGGGARSDGHDLPEVLHRAAECGVLVGDAGRAATLAQRALAALAIDGDPDRVALIENRLRWYLFWAGDRESAYAAVRRALDDMGPDVATLARARALAQLAGILMLRGDLESSRDTAQEAVAMSEALDSPGETALALGVLGWDLALLGDVEAGLESFRRGQAIGEALGSIEGMALAATNLAALLDRVGRSEDSLEAARAGFSMTERYGVARTYGAILLGHAAKAELALGRWDDAERSTSLGLRRGAIDRGALWLHVNRARLLVGRGRFAEAGVLLRRARAIDERLGGTEYGSALLAAEAELAVWTARHDDVLAMAEHGLESAVEASTPDPSLAWLAALVLRSIADALNAGGRPAGTEVPARVRGIVERIEAAVASAERRPGFTTGDRATALLALLRAEGSRVAGRPHAAAWSDVGHRWAALGRPFQVAYARLREAEAILASRGERSRAAEALVEAAGTAAALGAAPLGALIERLAEQARIALPETAGGAGNAATAVGAAAPGSELTPREAEILRLVAAGWTNQRIADSLFITRKTASVHVSNIMGKLGASNRGEAAALAHRMGMVVDPPLPVGHG